MFSAAYTTRHQISSNARRGSEPMFAPARSINPNASGANLTKRRVSDAWWGSSRDAFRTNKNTLTRCVRVFLFVWSGLRGSNPPPPPWQGGALPNELNPRIWCLRSESNQRHGDFQSPALPTELQRHTGWRLGWGSNPRPLA